MKSNKGAIKAATGTAPAFYRWAGNTLVLNVLGTAGARRDLIGKVNGDRLKVSVKAAPEAGKATRCMIQLLAKTFGVARADVELVYGETSRKKQFRIHSPTRLPEEIAPAQPSS
jgi:uncharacterized protein (TIGR00251 family)